MFLLLTFLVLLVILGIATPWILRKNQEIEEWEEKRSWLIEPLKLRKLQRIASRLAGEAAVQYAKFAQAQRELAEKFPDEPGFENRAAKNELRARQLASHSEDFEEWEWLDRRIADYNEGVAQLSRWEQVYLAAPTEDDVDVNITPLVEQCFPPEPELEWEERLAQSTSVKTS